ncbi:putative reverse transcriptase domain, reverse transcriptase zinc-binding domain protein [Tanacetum coccineum]
MAVLEEDGSGHTMETIKLEYEWKPPMCMECHVFGHSHEQCPKSVKEQVVETKDVDNEGFTTPSSSKPPKAPVVIRNQFDALGTQDDTVIEAREMSRASDFHEQINEEIQSEGLNHPLKQSEVPQVVNENNLSICAILESHVEVSSLANVCSKVFQTWEWTSNGDFNVALNMEDVSSDSFSMNSAMNDFKECVANIEVLDVNCSGLHYTWNQKPKGRNGILKKLDRIMDRDVIDLFLNKVSADSNNNMVRDISNEEIKASMFDIGDDQAPGLDGFTSAFFNKGWDIVGTDVCNAIRDFLSNGKILKEINHMFIALIPKVATPLKVNDYHPISCCNVLYKCISKILTKRIIDGIKEVVSENQSAFVSGRRILDNILLTQELMHNYHRDRGPPRFGFHPIMIKWIMACVTSASFLLSINGDIHGYFQGKRGLRQGDPLYHKHCEEINIINVCFADDLFIFSRGEVDSAQVIMDSLKEFKQASRDITHEGFRIYDSVADMEANGACTYIVKWRDVNGNFKDFSIKNVWEAIRPRGTMVWANIRQLAGMDHIQPVLNDIMLFIKPMDNQRMKISIIGRLILAAASYYIWMERNNRIFKKIKKTPKEIEDMIMVTVRLKLLTFKFKNTSEVNQILSKWKMPTLFRRLSLVVTSLEVRCILRHVSYALLVVQAVAGGQCGIQPHSFVAAKSLALHLLVDFSLDHLLLTVIKDKGLEAQENDLR